MAAPSAIDLSLAEWDEGKSTWSAGRFSFRLCQKETQRRWDAWADPVAESLRAML